MRPRTKDQAKKLCAGCRNDRYNMGHGYQETEADAPVASEYCWSLHPGRALYCRALKEWVMPCHSGARQRWVAEYAQTGRKPQWHY